GWLTCNGQEVSRTTYALLFSIIGTTYGAGNGSTTFNLPNFQDRFLYGKGSTSTVGDAGGEETHTLSVPELPAHVHRITARGSNAPSNGHGIIAGANDGGTGPFLYDDTTLASDFMSIESIGQDVPHENRPPFSRVVWLVKA
ncbi:MAG TPA: tail fiber protein, partial [Nitrososphaera sp.]|nr:tail fiber protein [Nitrososphaera sp.]